MRQVPRYAIIGTGKMATHFAHYLKLLAIPHTQISRNEITPEKLQSTLQSCDRLCILISDKAIPDFIDAYALRYNNKIIHFSGSLVVEGCYSAHPLMTFGAELYTQEQYQSFPFIIEQEGSSFDSLLPGIPNQHYQIPKNLKPFYHSLCVMSGNFSCILWQKYFSELQKTFNISEKDAKPYLNIIFQNIFNNPHSALTGPLVRQDKSTIESNVNALNNDPFQAIYQAFVNAFQNIQQEMPCHENH